ncbi:MAG: LysE family transporter [Firmicutes bacterium]|nr:LysE family transporter [Bacillota bacterium]
MINWIQFFSYVFVTAATPGPNNLMSMSNAARMGIKKSFPFNLGILTGFFAVMMLCTFFCGVLSELIPAVKTPMIFVGAAYMLWLAWKIFRSSPDIGEDDRKGNYISGIILQFVNPKIYIYCIVSMEVYILPCYQGQWGILVFFAFLLAFIGFLFNMLWAVLGSALRMLFSKYAKITNTVMALLLVYCAVYLFI